MRSKQTLFAVLCGSLLFPATLLYGQANGSFSGTISDKTGGVLTGATVKVSSQGTGVERETKTDDSGHYLVPLLPVAFYTVHVEAAGFQASEQKDLRLQIDEHREVDFTLNPASVSSTVEVTATDVAVQTTNPTLGQVITSEQVATLPLNGRDFVQLATLTPGTTQETNPNSFFNGGASSEVSARGTFSLSVGGSRVQSTDWLLDNNDNNELTAGGISILPSIDAIQEFKVLTYNYSAEYGTRAGPTVLVTTKSGSNNLHGSLFEYFRNTDLDARSYFAAFREQFNLNQYGGSLGGAIQKDKTFFFVDYQGKHQRHGIPFIGLVPTAAMMKGDFTMDPLGIQRGSAQSSFPNLLNPYGVAAASPAVPTEFQCDPSGNPLPALADGTQAGWYNLQQDSVQSVRSNWRSDDPVVPAEHGAEPGDSNQFTRMSRCGNWMRIPSMFGSITTSRARTRFLRALATTRQRRSCQAALPDSLSRIHLPVRRTSRTTGATSQSRKPTSFPITPSTNSMLVITESSTTS